MKTASFLAAFACLCCAATADAQQMSLQIENGQVTLDAQNVSVRQILAEWARVGGAKIVNGDKVTGAPVTLRLTGIPERQALDTILRGVGGYMLAARPPGSTGVSTFDRIMILPSSSAPRATPAAVAGGFPGQRPMPQAPPPVQTDLIEDEDNDPEPEPEFDEEGGAEVVPQPGENRPFGRRPNVFPNPMGGAQPFVPQVNYPQPVEEEEGAAQPQQVTPANPFGVPPGASTMPGVIAPVPQDQQQRPPRPPV